MRYEVEYEAPEGLCSTWMDSYSGACAMARRVSKTIDGYVHVAALQEYSSGIIETGRALYKNGVRKHKSGDMLRVDHVFVDNMGITTEEAERLKAGA